MLPLLSSILSHVMTEFGGDLCLVFKYSHALSDVEKLHNFPNVFSHDLKWVFTIVNITTLADFVSCLFLYGHPIISMIKHLRSYCFRSDECKTTGDNTLFGAFSLVLSA